MHAWGQYAESDMGVEKKIFSPLVTEGSSVEKEPHVNRNYEWAHAAKWRRNCRLMQSTALMHVQVFYGYRRPEPTHIEQRKVLDNIAYGQDMGVTFFCAWRRPPLKQDVCSNRHTHVRQKAALSISAYLHTHGKRLRCQHIRSCRTWMWVLVDRELLICCFILLQCGGIALYLIA